MKHGNPAIQARIDHIEKHPDEHQHETEEELKACCLVGDTLYIILLETHKQVANE